MDTANSCAMLTSAVTVMSIATITSTSVEPVSPASPRLLDLPRAFTVTDLTFGPFRERDGHARAWRGPDVPSPFTE